MLQFSLQQIIVIKDMKISCVTPINWKSEERLRYSLEARFPMPSNELARAEIRQFDNNLKYTSDGKIQDQRL
jgi:hypothetical protein